MMHFNKTHIIEISKYNSVIQFIIYSFLLGGIFSINSCDNAPNTTKEHDMQLGKADKYSEYINFANGEEIKSGNDAGLDQFRIEFKDVILTFDRRTEISNDSSQVSKSLYLKSSGPIYVMEGCVERLFPLMQGAILNERYNWSSCNSEIEVSTHTTFTDSLNITSSSFEGYLFKKEYFGFMYREGTLNKYAWVHLSNDTLSTIIYDYAFQK